MINKRAICVCACCGEILHSKHQHDFVQCECENGAFVDGMGERIGAKDMTAVKPCLTMAEARRLSAAYKIKPTKPKRKSQPPAFWSLHLAWNAQGHAKHLRFGQWFIGQYMPADSGPDIDTLWNTTNLQVATEIIAKFYRQYQWEMA